jgi:hypothetical protein
LRDYDDDRYIQLRATAADLAVRTMAASGNVTAESIQWADFWLGYLLAHESASITVALAIQGPDGKITNQILSMDGAAMATNMTVDDTITLTVKTEDDHGDPTSDAIVFASDDNGTVITWTTDGLVSTGKPVAEGTVNVSISDPSAPSLAPTAVAITVGAGATSQISVDATVNPGANVAPTA